jgi:hypothetical protein
MSKAAARDQRVVGSARPAQEGAQHPGFSGDPPGVGQLAEPRILGGAEPDLDDVLAAHEALFSALSSLFFPSG